MNLYLTSALASRSARRVAILVGLMFWTCCEAGNRVADGTDTPAHSDETHMSAAGIEPALTRHSLTLDLSIDLKHQQTPTSAGRELGGEKLDVIDATSNDGEQVNPAPVSITSVLQRVFESHPSVREAESLQSAERVGIESARAGYYPYLQVSSALADRSEAGQVTVSAVQPLFDGGLTRAQVRRAQSQTESAEWNLQRVRLSLSDEVLQSSFEILVAEEQLRLFERYLIELQGSRQTIERRADKGVSPDADVQTVMVRIAQAEAGRESVKASRSAARSRLSGLLNGPPPDLRWPDESLKIAPDDLGAVLAAVDDNPLVRLDQQAIVTQKAAAETVKASIWPQLSLQHRRQFSGQRFDPSNDSTLLVLQYQTTNGYRAYQGYEAELARLESATRRLDTTRSILKAQFRADFVQYLTSLTQYSTQLNAARSLSELVSSYRRQFEVGRKTWIELLNAQREAHEARMLLTNYKRGFWQSDLRILLQGMDWQRLGLDAHLSSDVSARIPSVNTEDKEP